MTDQIIEYCYLICQQKGDDKDNKRDSDLREDELEKQAMETLQGNGEWLVGSRKASVREMLTSWQSIKEQSHEE